VCYGKSSVKTLEVNSSVYAKRYRIAKCAAQAWAPPGFSAGGGKHRGAERGGVWGAGIPLPSRLGRLGERRELLSGVRGGAPAADVFLAYFGVRNRLW